jgi:N-glycosylase/DNA lyase
LKADIRKRLNDFAEVPQSKYFYELCYCICTPQSKAANAYIVQRELEQRNFYDKPFNPATLLRKNTNYIRFHNTKAERLLLAREKYPETEHVILSDMTTRKKREWLAGNIKGIGMKEASHFLRNIGFRNLTILDRHILKHLVLCNIYGKIPKVATKKDYLSVEKKFLGFSRKIKISVDELDLLFWSYETDEILK